MRRGLLAIMFLGWLFGPPSIVQKATEAYDAKKYAEAAAGFSTEIENYPGQSPAMNFNIAQCWFKLDSIAKATSFFGKVTNAAKENPQMGSWAWNNMGCIFADAKQGAGGMPGQMPTQPQAGGPGPQQGDAAPASPLEQALKAFKDALKLDHDNELARYNYELIKRKIQQQQQQQDQNQDQNQDQKEEQQDQKKENQDQQKQKDNQNDSPKNQENKADQNQPKPGEGENPQQMSEGEAERLLEAMDANEKKFLQQLERGRKVRTYNEDGPDW